MVNEKTTTTRKFEEQLSKMLQAGYTQGDLTDIVTEVAREERMKRFNVGRSSFMPGG
jgi:hypothetical protein